MSATGYIDDTVTGAIAANESPPRFGLAFFCFFAIYTFIPLDIGGASIPAPLVAVLGISLLALNYDRLPQNTLMAMLLVIAVFVLAVLGGAQPTSNMGRRALVLGMHAYCMIAGLGFALEVTRWNDDERKNFLHVLLLVVFIGVCLEKYTPVGEISDSFRQMVYQPTRLYGAGDRDILTMGAVRPKFFGSEPSYLGVMTAVLVYLNFINAASVQHRATLLAAGGFAFLLIRSPIVGGTFLMMALYYAVRGGVRLRGVVWISAAVASITGLWFYISAYLTSLLIDIFPRIANLLSGQDGSLILRLVVPADLVLKTLQTYPLFGVGPGGKALLIPILQHSPIYFLYSSLLLRQSSDIENVAGATFFLMPLYLGLVGGTLFLLAIRHLCKTLSRAPAISIIVPHLVICTVIGFSVQYWGYLFVILAFTPQPPATEAVAPFEEIEDAGEVLHGAG